MKNRWVLLLLVLTGSLFFAKCRAQQLSNLPLEVLPAKENLQMPLVVLITGDGGWKDFDPLLAKQLNVQNVPVVALNALHYFWHQKTPEESTLAIEIILNNYLKLWHKDKFILIGYSFGADVLPFILNRLPPSLLQACSGAAFISPGTSTDFEIHLSQMMGKKEKWKYDVIRELQSVREIKPLIILGKEERYFPVKSLNFPAQDIVVIGSGKSINFAQLILGKFGFIIRK